MSKSPVKRTRKKRYDWPPPVAPEDAYVVKQKNPIHSVLTALPVIMLVVGLYFYYQAESAQSEGSPIRAQSKTLQGIFTGLSVVQSGAEGRHYLWVTVNDKPRGVRIQPHHAEQLNTLPRNTQLNLKVAPTVQGSRTVWAWYIEQNGQALIDDEALLQ